MKINLDSKKYIAGFLAFMLVLMGMICAVGIMVILTLAMVLS